MNDFAAIDFETANEWRSSVCSVGVVIVRDGQIAETVYRLICPSPNYYSWFCSAVHGMSFRDTENADSFPAVWAEIAPKIAGLPLVAHNSPFDESCLRAAHKACNMKYAGYTFYCTYRAAKKVFGKTLPNHRLHTVAKHCGYNLKNHHNALADAEACAWIAMKII
ncbi:MAG: 3'-5' exonuclease [Prevotellaceae bacterium]|jgi:DNA polymerase-3 subunit epsilon|nr:3'-5' exonuclease [Prevotellaceae bacterium]